MEPRAALRCARFRGSGTQLATEFVWLAVFVHNERARHLYQTLGFRFRGVPEAEADAWLEVVGNPDRPARLMFLDAGDPGSSAPR